MKEPGEDKGFENQSFGTPPGYFESSAGALKNRLLWLDEHKAYPALKMAWRDNIFSVPENYFQRSEIQLELLPYGKLKKAGNENKFNTPPAYFENFEIGESAVLNAIPKTGVFTIPENYFEKAAGRTNINLKPQAKIIGLNRRWLNFAAAAVFIMTSGLWLYNSFFKAELQDDQDCGGIACVDKRELLDRKNLEALDDEQLYELVNTRELEEKLNNNNQIINPAVEDSTLDDEELMDNI